MKLGSLVLALSLLAAPLTAQGTVSKALDSAAAFAARSHAAQVQSGTAPSEGHAGGHEACVEFELPRWAPIHIGALELDMSPTKHVVWLIVAALLTCAVLIGAAVAHRRH